MKLKKLVSAFVTLSMLASVCLNDVTVSAAAASDASQQQANDDTGYEKDPYFDRDTEYDGRINLKTEEDNPAEHHVKLSWTGISDSENRYDYAPYRKVEDGEWQRISAWAGEKTRTVRVLNVYPGSNSRMWLSNWMSEVIKDTKTPAGKNKITVTPVCIDEFNKNPDEWLRIKESYNGDNRQGQYYDVVMFGTHDGNRDGAYEGAPSKDLTQKSYDATVAFAATGRGVLFGHDTVTLLTGNKYFCQFAKSLGCTLTNDGDWKDCNTVKDLQDGYLTRYPWDLLQIMKDEKRTTLTIPKAHCLGQFTGGTDKVKRPAKVWMKFTTGHKTGEDGSTDDAYLFSNKNFAMIQTGHSSGQATDDEREILANTLIYLNQVTNLTYSYDGLYEDKAQPDTPSVNKGNYSAIALSSTDHGTKYSYCVKALPGASNKKAKRSNIVKKEAISGVKEFIVSVSDKQTGGAVKTSTIPADANGKATFKELANANPGTWYLRVKAVDKSGNVSPEQLVPVNIPSILKVTSMNTTVNPTNLDSDNTKEVVKYTTTLGYTARPTGKRTVKYTLNEGGNKTTWSKDITLPQGGTSAKIESEFTVEKPDKEKQYSLYVELVPLTNNNQQEDKFNQTIKLPVIAKDFKLQADATKGQNYKVDLKWDKLDTSAHQYTYNLSCKSGEVERSIDTTGSKVVSGKIIANDKLFIDKAAPDAPAVDTAKLDQVSLSANDHGTNYTYSINANPSKTDTYRKGRTSGPVSAVALSEVQGYIAGISASSDPMKDLLTYSNGKLTSKIITVDKEGKGVVNARRYTAGTQYLHVYAVDYAGNVSKETVVKLKEIKSVTTTADTDTLKGLQRQNLKLQTAIDYTVKENRPARLHYTVLEKYNGVEKELKTWKNDVTLESDKNSIKVDYSNVEITPDIGCDYRVRVDFYTLDSDGKEVFEKTQTISFKQDSPISFFNLSSRVTYGKDYHIDLTWHDLDYMLERYGYNVYQREDKYSKWSKRSTSDSKDLLDKAVLKIERSDKLVHSTRDPFFLDKAKPTKPEVNAEELSEVKVSATDNGTNYDYYVESYALNSNLRNRTTNSITSMAKSDIQGFIVGINNSEEPMTELIKRNDSGKLVSGITPAEDGKLTFNVTNEEPGINYIHVYAVDNAGNVSDETVTKVNVPPTVDIKDVNTVADKTVLQPEEDNLVNFISTIKYNVKPSCEGMLQYTLFENDKQIDSWQENNILLDRYKDSIVVKSNRTITANIDANYVVKVEFYTKNEAGESKLEKTQEIPLTVAEPREFKLYKMSSRGKNYHIDLYWDDLTNECSKYGYDLYQSKENGNWVKRSTSETESDNKNVLKTKRSDGIVYTRDQFFLDQAAPEKPMVNTDNPSDVQLSSTDNGTNYQYYVESTPENKKLLNKRKTNTVKAVAQSQLKGFIVGVSKSKDSMKDELVKYDKDGKLVSKIILTTNGEASFDVSKYESGLEYVHVFAVDNAGNVSEEAVKDVVVPIEYFNSNYALLATESDVTTNVTWAKIKGDIYGKEAFNVEGTTYNVDGKAYSSNKIKLACSQVNVTGGTKDDAEVVKDPGYMDHILVNMTGCKNVNKIVTYNNEVISVPTICENTTDTWGEAIDINADLVSKGNVTFNSHAVVSCGKDDAPVVLASENGDIHVEAQGLKGAGLIYAPNGTVIIHVNDLNYTGSIIAKKIEIHVTNYDQKVSDKKW